MTDWVLKKDRTCKNCGQTFAKGTVVGRFLSHVQRCKVKKGATS